MNKNPANTNNVISNMPFDFTLCSNENNLLRAVFGSISARAIGL